MGKYVEMDSPINRLGKGATAGVQQGGFACPKRQKVILEGQSGRIQSWKARSSLVKKELVTEKQSTAPVQADKKD